MNKTLSGRSVVSRAAGMGLGIALLCGAAGKASAAIFNVDWMNYTPYVMNTQSSPLPTGQTFALAGVGNVRVDYNFVSPLQGWRANVPSLITGSVTSGPDSYSWSDHEDLRVVNFNSSGMDAWSATFTFLDGPVAAGNLVLGVFGLGRIDLDSPGAITTASVSQNGTFLGEWGPLTYGPNQFTSGVGSFSLQNALPGDLTPGNPAFNSQLALVRIDDAVSSLTVNFNQIGQDGIGVNIGSLLVPAPGSAALLGLGGLIATRRRRR